MQSVIGESVDLLGEPARGHALDDRDERLPALVEESAVGDLVSQGVLEPVLEIRGRRRARGLPRGLPEGEKSSPAAIGVGRESYVAR